MWQSWNLVKWYHRGIVILPPLMAELTVSEDWRPPKEFLLGVGEPFEPGEFV